MKFQKKDLTIVSIINTIRLIKHNAAIIALLHLKYDLKNHTTAMFTHNVFLPVI